MEIVKSKDSKYEEYERLLLERDQTLKDAEQNWINYVNAFGELITAVFEEKVECIRLKKTIAFYQKALNHGGKVDQNKLNLHLQKEMAEYNAQLNRMKKDNDLYRSMKVASAYQVKRSKEIYHKIAKLIHPDINPETEKHEELTELWNRAALAYNVNNPKELAELEVLVGKALDDLGAGTINVDIPDIDTKIDELKTEISDIISAEPYIYGDLLRDDKACEEYKKELQEELEKYKKYHEELNETLEKLFGEGGLTLEWEI